MRNWARLAVATSFPTEAPLKQMAASRPNPTRIAGTNALRFAAAFLAVATLATTASALPVGDFLKQPRHDQGVYASGAVSMLMYSYAANNNLKKASCINQWYFKGSTDSQGNVISAPGPVQLSDEIDKAAAINPAKFQVEGVILGVTNKVCDAAPLNAK
jgi:hypothetical protein